MAYINYNWRIIPESEAPALLPGSVFRAANGLFESMLAIRHNVPLLPMHIARLVKGMQQVSLPIPQYFNEDFLREQIKCICEAEAVTGYAKIRLQAYMHNNVVHFILEAAAIAEHIVGYNTRGLQVGVIQENLKEIDDTANLKRIAPGMYTSVNKLIAANQWDDVLLVKDGWVMESGTSNIFWVEDGAIFTPPVASGCIEGVMRAYLLNKASALRYHISEMPLNINALQTANEVFLTNAVRRIKWVGDIDGKQYTNTTSRRLYELLFNY